MIDYIVHSHTRIKVVFEHQLLFFNVFIKFNLKNWLYLDTYY